MSKKITTFVKQKLKQMTTAEQNEIKMVIKRVDTANLKTLYIKSLDDGFIQGQINLELIRREMKKIHTIKKLDKLFKIGE